MKKTLKFLLSLLLILGFKINVEAANYSNSITTYASGTKYEFVSGLPIYYNKADSYNLYILDNGTYYNSRTNLTDPTLANEGFAYVINNSNVTNNSNKNYYIAQVAILWYQDYLNGNNNNISSTMKTQITNTTGDSVCYYINKLFNNAKEYATDSSSISFLDKTITFTRNGSYYYSNVIEVETNNLNSTPSVKLYNAPSSATIINNTITKDGKGSFQIRIPSSSMTGFDEKDFEVYITGTGYEYSVYKYTNYGVGDAIYGRVYTSSSKSIEASLPVIITGSYKTNVRISVLNENGNYISGLSYSIYSGDCSKTTCYSNNLITTFTTKSTYTELTNELNSGTYTLALKSNTNYDLPSKKLINITNTTSIQEFIIEENESNNNDETTSTDESMRNFTIYNSINDSTDIIKIYSTSGTLINSYRSDKTNYSISLTEGTYYIVDTLGEIDKLYFKITSNGLLKVKYDDEYVNASSISLDKAKQDYTIIDDDDESNVYYDESSNTYYIDGIDDLSSIEISNNVDTTTDVEINWLSNIIDCPITSLSSTLKYIVGAIILSTGLYLVIRNVKKSKNNI